MQGIHDASAGPPAAWRCIEMSLDSLSEAGEAVIRPRTNLPCTIDATTMAALHRK